MKAVQVERYSEDMEIRVAEIPVPEISETEVLIMVKAAAVNPLDLMNTDGSVKLIQDYSKPFTAGNECSGIIVRTGDAVRKFQVGDHVYTRLPVNRIGAFAEYAAADESAVAKMPVNLSFAEAAAVPLTGLTAYQAIVEELEASAGDTVLITGGSGSFGQMAVPVADALGLKVIVTGNTRSRDRFIQMGVERYIDYTREDYWKEISGVDHVIDTLGPSEFENEMSVLKKGGKLVSLRTGPNRIFAEKNNFTGMKKLLFTLAGRKYDRAAVKQEKEYRFLFVRESGVQLERITEIVEKNNVRPEVDPERFSLEQAGQALRYVRDGRLTGKVIIEIQQ